MGISMKMSKLMVLGISLLMLLAALFSPVSNKAEASVSWGQEVTEVAKRYMGVKYKAAGTTPKGFDASGFTQYVFDKSAADIKLPRTSKDQYKAGKAVKQKDIKEGDLVFFNTSGKGVSFVGISLGKDKFIAVTVSKGVSINSMKTKYWKDRYVGARRVLK
ncbi:MAG: C40 family peptidase [Bacillota bacterium]|uniref:C40 family peptidase n=1 Tax=Cytobacillus firmus TaxID=1399 RepID=UPI001073158D|nr:NlpC/P60 family protein [Diaphorobacter sp. DS2]